MRDSSRGFLRGFTLLELLITTSLVSLVGLAIANTFSRGLQVWDKVNALGGVEREAGFVLDEFARELRSSFVLDGVEFEGDRESVSFPTLVKARHKEHGDFVGAGRVGYFYDSARKTLSRSAETYAQVLSGSEARAEPLLNHVRSVDLSYYYFDSRFRNYKWEEEWEERESMPIGIKITLGIELKGKREQFVRTVYLYLRNDA
ncbi:MAG: prepilin-type N-terminal cleavage/methylation domain-containing protein [Candidatus Omnitrophica bacterium]|nr:prepilin-type N-terminal cleavage/methylation domain-containing protein [Candidatus Omnitrophota bacterium]